MDIDKHSQKFYVSNKGLRDVHTHKHTHSHTHSVVQPFAPKSVMRPGDGLPRRLKERAKVACGLIQTATLPSPATQASVTGWDGQES